MQHPVLQILKTVPFLAVGLQTTQIVDGLMLCVLATQGPPFCVSQRGSCTPTSGFYRVCVALPLPFLNLRGSYNPISGFTWSECVLSFVLKGNVCTKAVANTEGRGVGDDDTNPLTETMSHINLDLGIF